MQTVRVEMVRLAGGLLLLGALGCSKNEAQPAKAITAPVSASTSPADDRAGARPVAVPDAATDAKPSERRTESSPYPVGRTLAAAKTGATYFWTDEANIPGTLVRKQLEYSGGMAVPVVVFDFPVRIDDKPGHPKDQEFGVRESVREAWLSYNGIDKAAVDALVGKKVTYRGMLNPMQTGHHITDPWLDGKVVAR